MKRLIAVLLCALLVCLSGCGSNTGSGGQGGNPPVDSSKPKDQVDIPAAYYEKYEELALQYGEPDSFEETRKDDEVGFGCYYLTGVAVVAILDFNGDGVDDILFVYHNGTNPGENYHDLKIPRAQSYQLEVWTVLEGELVQLVNESQIGAVSPVNAGAPDMDYCFFSILRSRGGVPVIQLYSEDRGLGSCVYTNIYYSDAFVVEGAVGSDESTFTEGAVARVELTYLWPESEEMGASFTLNGDEIDEAAWDDRVSYYDTILFSAMLTAPTYTRDGLMGNFGLDLDVVLDQTKAVVADLKDGKLTALDEISGDFIPVYLHKIDQVNRAMIGGDMSKSPQPQLYFYDIDGNGVPEMLLQYFGEYGDNWYEIYTVVDRELVLAHEGFAAVYHALYENGENGLIGYMTHAGTYEAFEMGLDDDYQAVAVQVRYGSAENGEYPDLESLGLGTDYRRLGSNPAPIPFTLYHCKINVE